MSSSSPMSKSLHPATVLASLLVMFVWLLASNVGAEEKPNIILLMGDDHGWEETGYNGHPDLKTPVLDEMAATGLRLNRFYAGHPSCSPSAWQRTHRTASESLRYVFSGLLVASRRGHDCSSSRKGGIRAWAFRQMACRHGEGGIADQPGRDGIR